MYTRSVIKIDNERFPIISDVDLNNKPILLICGGGPGIPQYILEYLFPSVLNDYFSTVYFDYRGTGVFPLKRDIKEMTTECYLSDIKNLAQYLISLEKDKKIFIMGHSFGSYIALLMVRNYPEYFKGYLSMSQICNQFESECAAWEYMIKWYQNHNMAQKATKLERYDIPNNPTNYQKYIFSRLRDTGMHEIGIGTTRSMKSPVKEIFFPSLRCSMYGASERINIWRRKFKASGFPVSADAMRFNAFNDVQSIDVPIYFLAGKYDYTCNVNLQREYYEVIKTPYKRFFLFEDAAHSPIYECPNESRKILSKIING